VTLALIASSSSQSPMAQRWKAPTARFAARAKPGLSLLGLLRAHERRKVLRLVDGLSDFDMRRAQLGEWRCCLLVARLCTPSDQPSRLPRRQSRVVGRGHDREGLPRWPRPRGLALRLAPALRVTGDGGLAARIAALLARALEAQGITAAGVPPCSARRLIGREDTAAPVSAARALWPGGGAKIAPHWTLAEAQMGGDGMARPAVLPPRPHLLMAFDPAGPTRGRLLRSGREQGWDGDSDGAIHPGHLLTTDGIMDGGERRPMRVEHRLEGFHPMLEPVQPLRDLGGLGCPGARPIGRGASPIARDDLHLRVGPQPRRQGRGLPIGPQGDRLPACQSDPDGPRGLACSPGELVDAQGPWRAVARERQATDATAEGLTAERASQAPTQTHAGRPAQREPEGDQPRD
jgi:hypothetical protein